MLSLKDARKKRGITQVAVASALGISRQTYSKLEQDPALMKIEQAEKACDFMGYSPDEISFFAEKCK
ncbi:MAG: helix-turn-helix transcriptional regulator [Coriobacteriales bacterium]|nr:helix-turn-helix transcriptional regulator [Coriobacteriales bacterium]